MAKLNVKQRPTIIKASYKELTAADLLAIEDDTPRALLQALSDAPPAFFDDLSADELLALYPLVSFLEEPAEAISYVSPRFDPPAVDVASDTFNRLELARMKAGVIKKPYRLLPQLARVYFGDPEPAGSAADLMALGALILEDLHRFMERFKDLSGEELGDDEIEAGIEALHSFGPYGIAESIAAKYGCKPFEVFEWSAEEVYMDLLYSQTKNKYQENLREIEKRKSPKK